MYLHPKLLANQQKNQSEDLGQIDKVHTQNFTIKIPFRLHSLKRNDKKKAGNVQRANK
jgi:hypothetical protein